MRFLRLVLTAAVAAWSVSGVVGHASSHREAPITALDHKADITDFYAFVSYDPADATKVTFILCVDPFLEPETARTGRHSTRTSCTRSKSTTTTTRLRMSFSSSGSRPSSACRTCSRCMPAPAEESTLRPTRRRRSRRARPSFRRRSRPSAQGAGPASELHRHDGEGWGRHAAGNGAPLYVVPSNVGPRTMDYSALFNSAIY